MNLLCVAHDAMASDAVIEPQAGGRWYELDVDGSQCEIGRVAIWEPPGRLVLVWQLTPEFIYDPALVTEVEVTFTSEGTGTRVNLEHRDLERMGDKADAMHETVDWAVFRDDTFDN